jgi:hypothetical protein
MTRTRDQALETSSLELSMEIARANKLCRREEDECTDAESLENSDYDCSSSEEEDSYDSSFIDDTEVDEEETTKAMKQMALLSRKPRVRRT